MGNAMGGVCSSGINKNDSKVDHIISSAVSEKKMRIAEDQEGDSCFVSEASNSKTMPQKANSGGGNKVTPMHSQGGAREGAVEVLKTIGQGVSVFHPNSGFLAGMASNGREISILAFEVANTISKVANLSRSLSEENIQLLRRELSQSEWIKLLVSENMEELLSIAATDKRQEFDILLREVIRFGKQCKDPKWHNPDHYFPREDLNGSSQRQVREARAAIQELAVLAEYTSELYHELQTLESYEQDYKRKVEEVELLNQAGIGESLTISQGELNVQRKLVRSLQNKSLWSRNLEEIVEKLINIMTWIHQTISKVFDRNRTGKTLLTEDRTTGPCKLGVAGLALHYANIINQIGLIACRPTFIPSNSRDALYRMLPSSVKIALRSRLRSLDAREEPSYSTLKAEMDKTFQWLVPLAVKTIKAHQGCGRIGEWATISKETSKGSATQSSSIRLQTLYHADKEKTEQYIVELVTSLHCLIHQARPQRSRFTPLRSRSPAPEDFAISQSNSRRIQSKSQIIKPPSTGVSPQNRSETTQNPAKKNSSKNKKKDKGIWEKERGIWSLSKGLSTLNVQNRGI